jgi:hypothetical protein
MLLLSAAVRDAATGDPPLPLLACGQLTVIDRAASMRTLLGTLDRVAFAPAFGI